MHCKSPFKVNCCLVLAFSFFGFLSGLTLYDKMLQMSEKYCKANWSNTYACSTFPFTDSSFFTPPRFGSGSTERELHAIWASDSVVKGTENSLRRTGAKYHFFSREKRKTQTTQDAKFSWLLTISSPPTVPPSWKTTGCKYRGLNEDAYGLAFSFLLAGNKKLLITEICPQKSSLKKWDYLQNIFIHVWTTLLTV